MLILLLLKYTVFVLKYYLYIGLLRNIIVDNGNECFLLKGDYYEFINC